VGGAWGWSGIPGHAVPDEIPDKSARAAQPAEDPTSRCGDRRAIRLREPFGDPSLSLDVVGFFVDRGGQGRITSPPSLNSQQIAAARNYGRAGPEGVRQKSCEDWSPRDGDQNPTNCRKRHGAPPILLMRLGQSRTRPTAEEHPKPAARCARKKVQKWRIAMLVAESRKYRARR